MAKKKPSGVDAYRESIPTSGGSRPVGSGGGRAIGLSSDARARLKNSRDGKTLVRIATSPKLGAPTAPLKKVRARPAASSVGGGVAAASGALASGNDHVLILLGVLGLTAGGCAVAAARRRRGPDRR